jgi:hypothetical protein
MRARPANISQARVRPACRVRVRNVNSACFVTCITRLTRHTLSTRGGARNGHVFTYHAFHTCCCSTCWHGLSITCTLYVRHVLPTFYHMLVLQHIVNTPLSRGPQRGCEQKSTYRQRISCTAHRNLPEMRTRRARSRPESRC